MTSPSPRGRGNALWDGCRSARKELRFSSRWKSAAAGPGQFKAAAACPAAVGPPALRPAQRIEGPAQGGPGVQGPSWALTGQADAVPVTPRV